MILNQRNTENETTDHLITIRDSLLAHKARGDDLDEVIRGLNRAIKARLVREKHASNGV